MSEALSEKPFTLDPRMSRPVLEGLAEEVRDRVFKEVGAALTEYLLRQPDFDEAVRSVIQELLGLGHDLYMFDSGVDVDFDKGEDSQLWCGDWTKPQGDSTPLLVTFHSVKGVELEWSEYAKRRN